MACDAENYIFAKKIDFYYWNENQKVFLSLRMKGLQSLQWSLEDYFALWKKLLPACSKDYLWKENSKCLEDCSNISFKRICWTSHGRSLVRLKWAFHYPFNWIWFLEIKKLYNVITKNLTFSTHWNKFSF